MLSTALRQEKRNKGIQIGKEEIKLLLLVKDIVLYTENPKVSTKKKKLFQKINKLIH